MQRPPPATAATTIACLYLAPWPLTLLRRAHPGVPVAVLSDHPRRVLHACPAALDAGVQPGMREGAALSRCPELHAEALPAPAAQASWAALLELLYARSSDRVEGRAPGVAYLSVSRQAAGELAAALHAPVGLGRSQELALLAARRAAPGELRDAAATPGSAAERAFLALTPLAHLDALGLGAAALEPLHFLGARTLGDLLTWSAAQREALLGVDAGRRLNAFLGGARTAAVARHAPGQVLEAQLRPDAPLLEPGAAHAALDALIPGLWTALQGRTCAALSVHADTLGGRLSATRRLKWPLDEAGLRRAAQLALDDAGGLALGIEALSVQLSGLARPARQVGLWAGVAELEVTRAVLERFPRALVRVRWLDPYAYATDARYEWVDWLSGEARPTPMTPPRPPAGPTGPLARHERAVQRILAFFEGAP